jgi:hypothetical protein
MHVLLQEVQKMKNIDELEAFILKHGENIVDMMGAEIDRIEMKLRVSTLIPLGNPRFVSNFIKVSTVSFTRLHHLCLYYHHICVLFTCICFCFLSGILLKSFFSNIM